MKAQSSKVKSTIQNSKLHQRNVIASVSEAISVGLPRLLRSLAMTTQTSNKNIYRFFMFSFLVVLAIGFISYQVTHALFSDSAQSTNNKFIASQSFPTSTPLPTQTESTPTPTPTSTPTPTPTSTPTPTPTAFAIINEVFQASQNADEWVELFNPTSSSVDVGGWKIADTSANNNGQDDTFPTGIIIPSGGYAVIITNNSSVIVPGSAVSIQLTSANIGNGLNVDGDAVILKNPSNTVIDQMSYGNDKSVFPTPPAAPPAGQSVARSPNGVDTNTAADWVVDSSPSIGVAN